jgi:hypothetical protein
MTIGFGAAAGAACCANACEAVKRKAAAIDFMAAKRSTALRLRNLS